MTLNSSWFIPQLTYVFQASFLCKGVSPELRALQEPYMQTDNVASGNINYWFAPHKWMVLLARADWLGRWLGLNHELFSPRDVFSSWKPIEISKHPIASNPGHNVTVIAIIVLSLCYRCSYRYRFVIAALSISFSF